MWIASFAAIGYLLGSIPFGLIVSKLAGNVNIRESGSGNIGATNVMRTLGKGPALATFAGDFAKGFAAVLIARHLAPGGQAEVLAGLASIGGHVFPVFAGFRGGKGITTALAAFLLLAPYPTLLALGVWIVCFALWKYVSLGSVAASLSLPLLVLAMVDSKLLLLATSSAAALIVARHKDNLNRLLLGKEKKIGKGSK